MKSNYLCIGRLQARNKTVIVGKVLLTKTNRGVIKATRRMDKENESKTRILSESYYQVANFFVTLLNNLMKSRMRQIQTRILANVKSLTEQ